jgi:hypothetical protein
MTVPLPLPPLTRMWGYEDATALTEGPAFVLGRPSSRYPARWHRVRSGYAMPTAYADSQTFWLTWCGPSKRAETVIGSDEVPEGHPTCGTCNGRYEGHRGERGLIYSPDQLTVPRWCPSKMLYVNDGWNVGKCLACGQRAALRATGGPYNPREIIASHPPLDLIPGCGFHAWRNLVRLGDTAVCACRASLFQPGQTTPNGE